MEAITKELVDAAHDLTAADKANLYGWVVDIANMIDERIAAGETDAYLFEQKTEVAAILKNLSDVGIK